MATASEFIAECRKHLGEGSLYTGENPEWAWCAKFLSSVAKDLDMTQFDSWAASGVYAACTPVADEDVRPGDFVCFNFGGEERTNWFDHIGCVTWFDHSTGRYGTIEGNSGPYFCVGEYEYDNATWPPQTYFCRPDYEEEVTMKTFDEVWFGDYLNDEHTEAGYTSPGNILWGCFCMLRKILKILEEKG